MGTASQSPSAQQPVGTAARTHCIPWAQQPVCTAARKPLHTHRLPPAPHSPAISRHPPASPLTGVRSRVVVSPRPARRHRYRVSAAVAVAVATAAVAAAAAAAAAAGVHLRCRPRALGEHRVSLPVESTRSARPARSAAPRLSSLPAPPAPSPHSPPTLGAGGATTGRTSPTAPTAQLPVPGLSTIGEWTDGRPCDAIARARPISPMLLREPSCGAIVMRHPLAMLLRCADGWASELWTAWRAWPAQSLL